MGVANEIVIPLGMHAALRFGEPGTGLMLATSVTWQTESVKDVTVTVEKTEAEVQRRDSGGWEDTREAIKTLRISCSMMFPVSGDVTEAGYFDILRKTFITGAYNGVAASGTGIRVWAVDVDATKVIPDFPSASVVGVTGGGPIADCTITRFERVETNAENQVYNCEFKASLIHGYKPTWLEGILT